MLKKLDYIWKSHVLKELIQLQSSFHLTFVYYLENTPTGQHLKNISSVHVDDTMCIFLGDEVQIPNAFWTNINGKIWNKLKL